MLTNSYIAYVNRDYSPNKIELVDKYLLSVVYSVNVPNNEAVSRMYYDSDRNKLWFITTSHKVYRIDFSEDQTTKAISGSFGLTGVSITNYLVNGYGNRCIIDSDDGTCYLLAYHRYNSASDVNILYKIGANSNSIDDSLYIDYQITPTPGSYVDDTISMIQNELTKDIYIIPMHSYYNVNFTGTDKTNSGRFVMKVDTGLTSIEEILTPLDLTFGENNKHYFSTGYFSYGSNDNNFGDGHIAWNIVRNSLITGCDAYNHAKEIDVINGVIKDINLNSYTSNSENFRVYCGKTTGNIHFVSNYNHIVFDYDCNYLKTISVPSNPRNYYFIFNEYSEEFVRYSTTTYRFYMYDSDGTEVAHTHEDDVFSTNILKFVFLPGKSDDYASVVHPSVIQWPTRYANTTDTTPDIIFKVGRNPEGWTQQFRLVGDTNKTKITNTVIVNAEVDKKPVVRQAAFTLNSDGQEISQRANQIINRLKKGFWDYWNHALDYDGNPLGEQDLWKEKEYQLHPFHCYLSDNYPPGCSGL